MKSSKKLEPLNLSQHFLYKKVSDDVLLPKVRTKDNFQLLEHLIHEMYEKDYRRLSKMSDFGKKVGRFGLKEVLEQSKNDVDSFLGVDYEDKPAIGRNDLFEIDRFTIKTWGDYATGLFASGLGLYTWMNGGALPYHEVLSLLCFGCGAVNYFGALWRHLFLKKFPCYYHKPFSKIRVGDSSRYCLDREVGLRSALYHEYSHFLTDKLFFSGMKGINDFSVFEEGFACGIEGIVSMDDYNKTGNSAWVEPSLRSHLSVLCSAYLDTAYKICSKPSGSILRIADRFAKGITPENACKDNDILHGYGKALFKMLEFKYGSGIYKDVVNGNLGFF